PFPTRRSSDLVVIHPPLGAGDTERDAQITTQRVGRGRLSGQAANFAFAHPYGQQAELFEFDRSARALLWWCWAGRLRRVGFRRLCRLGLGWRLDGRPRW